MTDKITSFQDEYRFLSNFHVEPNGLCVEMQFQALKAVDEKDFSRIIALKKPAEARREGRKLRDQPGKQRPDWNQIRLAVMFRLVSRKFSKEPLRTKLLDTGDAELIEGNWWGDTFWGVCRGEGENHLGKILMTVRDIIREGGT